MNYKSRELKEHMNTNSAYKEGQWVPFRPIPLSGWVGLKSRIKGALLVLCNKADTVTWG